MNRIEQLEQAIEKINQRNKRVELDKAWELSLTRRLVIFFGTYIASALLLLIIGADNPYLGALVPACAYLLSTLTLPFLKRQWLKSRIPAREFSK